MEYNYKLPKKLIIRKKNDFNTLFKKGKTINVFPFYVKYLIENYVTNELKVGFTIRKRDFKKANKRNYLKRITKEIYRKNKYLIENKLNNNKILILIIYNTDKRLSFNEIENNLITILNLVSLKLK